MPPRPERPGSPGKKAIASNFLGQVGAFHQLFFAGMLINKGAATTPERRYDRRGATRKPPPAPAHRPRDRWVQPKLFEVPRDFTQFNEDTDADRPGRGSSRRKSCSRDRPGGLLYEYPRSHEVTP
jgi:hypothetical protein